MSSTFPFQLAGFFISSSSWYELTGRTSASAPPTGVEPTQPMASIIRRRRIGEIISALAEIRVQPREICHVSAWTFSRPKLFIFSTPQAMALAASGEPVTRAPISSLSSRRFSYVSVFIIPAPATSASALRAPSSGWAELPVADCPGAETAGRAITKIRATAQANANILRLISAEPLSDMDRPRTVRNFGRDFVGQNRQTLPQRVRWEHLYALLTGNI